ncbi:hypothetical protein GCM10017653_20300 [Ancylobacter defluvii]|uniref:Uncharacterized protein n=1 Tax=Ancylobacter defluvii TaxID=1282440 RepID=A0A9W6JXJ8_9HYPH|nr:hypothetical protein GCM10017653_20300 [Ancylobacter defluvii]
MVEADNCRLPASDLMEGSRSPEVRLRPAIRPRISSITWPRRVPDGSAACFMTHPYGNYIHNSLTKLYGTVSGDTSDATP